MGVTPKGAMASARLYSLLATAKAHKLNTSEYITTSSKEWLFTEVHEILSQNS